jgi:hypothetical protein
MYLIKLRFDSNIEGIYTYEEETAEEEFMMHYKLLRMLNNWNNILIGCNMDVVSDYSLKNMIKPYIEESSESDKLNSKNLFFVYKNSLIKSINEQIERLNESKLKEGQKPRKIKVEVITTDLIL